MRSARVLMAAALAAVMAAGMPAVTTPARAAEGLRAGLAAKPPRTAADVKPPDNAALVYLRAWMLLGSETPQRVQDLVKPEADWAPDAELVRILEENQGTSAR